MSDEPIGKGVKRLTSVDGETFDAGEPIVLEQSTLLGDVVRRYSHNRAAMAALFILLLMIIYSTVGPWLRPWSFDEGLYTNPSLIPYQLPNLAHWFGTDQTGRDLFVRLAMGGRVSLLIAFAATGIVLVVGVLYGCLLYTSPSP